MSTVILMIEKYIILTRFLVLTSHIIYDQSNRTSNFNWFEMSDETMQGSDFFWVQILEIGHIGIFSECC